MRRFFCLIGLLLLAACAQEPARRAVKVVTLSTADMDALMAQQSLDCAEDSCPDAVARLFVVNFQDASKSTLCTGTLVGPRLLLTNSHCLENGSLTQTCQGFYAVFNTKSKGHEVARCARIRFRHNFTTKGPKLSERDYALVELDRDVHAEIPGLDRAGFTPGDTVFPFVVDHINIQRARIVRLECSASDETRNGRDFVLKRCPAIGGNSGSPIMNDRGEVAGVLYAAQDTTVSEVTDLPMRIEAETISLGFPMNRVLEDLDTWL